MKTKTSGLSYQKLKENAPERMSKEAILTLDRGYLGDLETPNEMFARLSDRFMEYYPNGYNGFSPQYLRAKLYGAFSKCWISPASPVASNFGANSGFPVSCYGIMTDNSLDDIGKTFHEAMMLTKEGGGLGIDISNLIGPSKVTAWAKSYDVVVSKCNQKGVRRGNVALYLDVWHPDIELFLDAKDLIKGDRDNKIESNIAVKVDTKFRELLKVGDSWAIRVFHKIMELRMKYGSPYIFFSDNAKDADPLWYKDKGLATLHSQLCAEIMLASIPGEITYSCVLSSTNALYFDEWCHDDPNEITLPELGVLLLDAVNDDFVNLASNAKRPDGFRKAALGAEFGGPLGLGVFGLAALFMSKGLPFDSPAARSLNIELFAYLRQYAEKATKILADEKGERVWTNGWGRRNTHLIAIAPTTTSSLIGGGVTPGIQPQMGNIFSKSGAKGTFVRKNPFLEKLLEEKGKNTPIVWNKIRKDMGSVQGLDFLTDQEKLVFRTAWEIPQPHLVEMAIDRQHYIDQGQSFNLFIRPNADAQEIVDTHLLAWDGGLKSLYYVYSESEMNDQVDFTELNVFLRTREDCIYCQKAKKLLNEYGISYTEKEKPEGKVPEIWINGEMLEDGYNSLTHYLDGDEQNYEQEEKGCGGCEG